MAFQLSPEQEARIRAIVERGGCSSPEEAIDMALDALDAHGVPGFEGTEEELVALLNEGLNSEILSEEDAWAVVDKKLGDLRSRKKIGAEK